MKKLAQFLLVLCLVASFSLTGTSADSGPSVPSPSQEENPLSGTTVVTPKILRTTSLTLIGSGLAAEAGGTIKVYLTDIGTGQVTVAAMTTIASDGGWVVSVVLTAGWTTKVEVTATDLAGNEGQRQLYGYAMVDATAPAVTITSPVGGTTTDKASIVVAGNVTNDAWESFTDLTVRIQVGGAAPGTLTLDANGSFTVSVALAEGTNVVTITAQDTAGNVGWASVSVERTVAPSITTPTPVAATIENISAQIGQVIPVGENGIASVSVQSSQSVVVNFEAAQPVATISVTTSAAMETVSVQAQQLSQKPAPVPEPAVAVPGVVVSHYIEITVSATPSPPQAAISVQVSAVIEFKVPKSWLTTNNIASDSVRLLKYDNGQWIELPTTATGVEDATYRYYSATTTGFSTFAVTGKSAEQAAALNLILIIGISAVAAVVALSALYVVFAKRGR